MARTTNTSEEQLDPSLVHKKKARRRLVGALAFLGATGAALPFLLDPEPKSSPQEVQIRVPVREPAGAGAPVAPQAAAPTPAAPIVPPVPLDPGASKAEGVKDAGKAEGSEAGKADGKPSGAVEARAEAKGDAKAEAKGDAKADAKAEAKTDSRTDAKPDAKGDVRAEDKPVTPKAEGSKADAKKGDAKKVDARKDEGKKDEAKKADGKKSDGHKHYSVQIGAFASEDTAREQLAKASKLGLKTYTEKVTTASGVRYRARIGPFNSREQADQALAKLKSGGVDAAIVSP